MTEPTFISSITYLDPKLMYRWLENAFGFEPAMVISDANGDIAHAEMTFGNGRVMIGSEWSVTTSPINTDGRNTQRIHVNLEEGLDAHFERAQAAGAVIDLAPAEQFYGKRAYRAKDPEGHLWTFSQFTKAVTPEEWDAAMGFRTTQALPE